MARGHIYTYIYIYIYIYISGRCLHCTDLFHGWFFARHGTARGRQRTPIARSCTDRLVKPRCTDLHGKRASGFRISRICTVLHGRSLFIWILIWHCLWSSIHMNLNLSLPTELHQDPAKHRAPIARICTDPPLHGFARTCPNSMMHGFARKTCNWIPKCTSLHGFHASALSFSRRCTSLHGNFLRYITDDI